MSTVSSGAAAAKISDGKIILAGGTDGSGALTTTWMLTYEGLGKIKAGVWRQVELYSV